jgi:DNA-binding CsgD family transcriptional regulator
MAGQSVATRLSPREREIANLVAHGLTNKEIAARLGITERTVGTHLQNIFNKVGAGNRVEIATWWTSVATARRESASGPADAAVAAPTAVPTLAVPRANQGFRTRILIAACCIAVLVLGAGDGTIPTAATGAPVLIPGDLPVTPGDLVFQSKMDGVHSGFGPPTIVGDQSASRIRFIKGSIEYDLLKPGGLAGDGPSINPLSAYFAEIQISVTQGSIASFWFSLDVGDTFRRVGSYVVAVNTYYEYLQLGYFVQGEDVVSLAPPVPMDGLQRGRSFRIAALVLPPRYVVYLDGRKVTDVTHSPSPPLHLPSFQIFGDGTGSVHITAFRVYGLKSG